MMTIPEIIEMITVTTVVMMATGIIARITVDMCTTAIGAEGTGWRGRTGSGVSASTTVRTICGRHRADMSGGRWMGTMFWQP